MQYRSCMRVGTFVAILTVAVVHSAAAEVIAIKEGTFVFEGSGTSEEGTGRLDISGTKNFTFSASVDISGGRFNLYSQCKTPDCPPGAVVPLDAFWSGNDLMGTATLRGKTYSDVGGLESDSGAAAGFSGSVTVPPMTGGPVSVTVPFDFSGRFSYDLFGTHPREALLAGGGGVTLFLRPNIDGTSWELQRAVFQFLSVEDR
jgi:hypothetical protein